MNLQNTVRKLVEWGLLAAGSNAVTQTKGITANVKGNLVGNVEGDVVGNVTGDVTGDLTGNVNGDGIDITAVEDSDITLTVSGTGDIKIAGIPTAAAELGANVLYLDSGVLKMSTT